jgi:hypothetical protein
LGRLHLKLSSLAVCWLLHFCPGKKDKMTWKIIAAIIAVLGLRFLVRRFRDPGLSESSWE